MKKILGVFIVITASAALTAEGEWIAGSYVRPDENDTEAFYRECPNDVLKRSFMAHDAPVTIATKHQHPRR